MTTTIEIIWYLRAVETLSLVIGFVLAALAYRGYRKHGSRALLSGAIGFGMLGIASLMEGMLFEVVGLPLVDAHAFRSTLTTLGLLVLLYAVQKTS